MPTPDEIYEQTLREELDQGASQPVAKARANAARARARQEEEGSPSGGAEPSPAAGEGGEQPAAQGASGGPPQEARHRGAGNPAAHSGSEPARETAGNPGGGLRPAAAAMPAPGRSDDVPERVQRLLRVVKPQALKKVERAPLDRVNVWPHLMA